MHEPEPDVDLYLDDLALVVDRAVSQPRAPHELLERMLVQGDRSALRMVATREATLTSLVRERVLGYLTTGYFHNAPVDRRAASFLVAFDLETAVARRRLQKRCEPYHSDQPLFKASPQLLERTYDGALIPVDCIDSLADDGVVELGGVFARLDPVLTPGIVRLLRRGLPKAPLLVRIDPTAAWPTRPPHNIVETVLSPADPHWWRSLGLHPRTRTGGTYRLDPPAEPLDDIEAYWDYHIRGLRRIETSASRRSAEYLSMMLEELEESGPILIGRCVHMDTSGTQGTSPSGASVQHADLALNVYEADAIARRLSAQLRDGKVADASFRMHLLRLEEAPVAIVVPLTILFFQSRSLLRDLMTDQFQT